MQLAHGNFAAGVVDRIGILLDARGEEVLGASSAGWRWIVRADVEGSGLRSALHCVRDGDVKDDGRRR